MKKLLILFTLIISIFACNEPKKPVAVDTTKEMAEFKDTSSTGVEFQNNTSTISSPVDTSATVTAISTQESEVDVTAKDSINFEKYAVEVQELIKKAPLDFSSYPESKLFKTRITEAYNEGTSIDFGGHYILSAFGCGAGCIMGFMVDVRDGHIYDLPLGEENSCFWSLDRCLGKPDSRLFISAICKENEKSKVANYIAYLWNEEKKVFKSVNKEEFIIKK